jgi:putative nucleotidyltransferase with HDIG domain
MKRRVLFVDDEPSVLAGLQRRLRKQRAKWDMEFVDGGEKALAVMAGAATDVIVSDMRMPGMDGVALLQRVQREHPHVVRIVLSGHAEMEAAMRAVQVAHQFLSKPSETGVIEAVVERACALQDIVNDNAVKQIVGSIETLPALPKVYARLMQVIADPNASLSNVAAVLQQDMAMSAKILQLVNSAFFRLARTITKIEEAVAYLGFTTIKQVALAVEVFQEAPGGGHAAAVAELQRHSLLSAAVAAKLVAAQELRDDAFVAALLHDIGKLLLFAELPEKIEEAARAASAEGCAMHEAESRVIGVSHAEVGGYLLGLWGLPYPIVEAVTHHHAPSRVASSTLDLVPAIHIADALAHHALADNPDSVLALSPTYLEELGVAGEIHGWQQLALEAVADARPNV